MKDSGDVCVIYPVWNRLEYNMITLPALIYECQQSKVFSHLLIIDDMSEDGTTKYIRKFPIADILGKDNYTFMRRQVGGSTMQWNLAKKLCKGTHIKYIANFTNENIVPYRGLESLRDTFSGGDDIFAVGPQLSGNAQNRKGVISQWSFVSDEKGLIKEATHIGCGMVRLDLLEKFGDVPVKTGSKKLFGFTEYQNTVKRNGYKVLRNEAVRFLRLDESPMYSRAIEYHKRGWSRLLNCNHKALLNARK